VRRRDFITLIGGAAVARPFVARSQQPAIPAIGYLNTRAAGEDEHLVAAFHQGLKETGYVESRNVTIEYRWAEGRNDRLPALAADLVRRQVAVIAAGGTPPTIAAKAATAMIPIVFVTGADPVEIGLVASLSRPGGNLTGITTLTSVVAQKKLELLHDLLPAATVIALLINPTNPILAETNRRDLQAAARTLGLQILILRASSEREFETAFATLVEQRAGGLVIGTDAFFNSRSRELAALAARHAVPSISQFRGFAAAGGLMSYGATNTDEYHLVGVYTGRILKGENPADLPVQQATKADLIINLSTANALGLEVPPTLIARADEMIE
jgi:putative ABC transport system substrate-binding protein